MGVEQLEGPDPTVGLFHATYGTYVDDVYNESSHDPGCPPLTHDQRVALQDEGDAAINDPEYGYLEREPFVAMD
jgi:hypothetical protein